jgi:hypothetical protein
VAAYLAETARDMKAPVSPTPSFSDVSSSAKKKRKKKKKKKSDPDDQQEQGGAPDDEGGAQPTSLTASSRGAGMGNQRQEEEGDGGSEEDGQLSAIDGASNGTASATAVAAASSIAAPKTSSSNQSAVGQSPVVTSFHAQRQQQRQQKQSLTPTLFDLMVQEFFDKSKMGKTLLEREGGSPAYSHDEFWGRITSRSCAFRIRMGSVRDMTSRIACVKCRKSVETVLEEKTRLYVTRPEESDGVGPIHRVPFFSEDTYVRMEEGQYDDQILAWQREQQRELSFQIAFSDEDEDEVVWKLRGMELGIDEDDGDVGPCTNGDGNGGASELTHPPANDWRRSVLYDFLLGRGVAASGLAQLHQRPQEREDDVKQLDGATVNQPALDSDVVRGMAQFASITLDNYEKAINDCLGDMNQAKSELVAHHQRDHYRNCENIIDMTAFQVLSNADEKACAVISCYLRILSNLTLSLFMGATAASADETPTWRQRDLDELHDLALGLWDLWLQSVQEVVSNIVQYEMDLRSIADRHGRFPQAFSSSKYRNLYHTLVWTKLHAAQNLFERMSELLDTPVEAPGLHPRDHKTSARRKIICYSIFCQHFVGLDYKRSPPVLPLDQGLQSVLEAIRECVQTPHKVSWDQVQQEHETRRQRLSRRCERVFSENDVGRIVDVVRGHLTGSAKVLNNDLVGSTSNDSADAELSMNSRYRDYLKEIGIQMISGWLRERCHQKAEVPIIIPSMPVKLLLNTGHSMDGFNCVSNAETRAVCILLALFYRWISDQCDAWRAELAEKELLTSMSSFDADHASADGGISTNAKPKSSKKKKKKRGDSQTPDPKLSDKTVDTQSLETTVERSLISSEACVERCTSPKSLSTVNNDARFPTIESQLSDEGELGTPICGQMHDTSPGDSSRSQVHPLIDSHPACLEVHGNAAANHETSSDKVPNAALSNAQESLLLVDSLLKIGVHGDSEFVSAEDFLVGRLMAILNEPSLSTQ